MNKYSLINRFKYWLDKKMAKGTISIIRILSVSVIFVVLLVSYLIVRFHLKDSFLETLWDSLANIINAWVPSAEEGNAGYIILNAVTALFGLIFTSILFGAVNNIIEDKINGLRKGNSVVLEKNHTVILGYNLGEHTLLKQLILANDRKKKCIVICTDIEKPDLEDDLKNNVDIPGNIEVICRNGDITKINDLRCCSIETARNVIINAIDDNRRIKAILTVNALKREFKDCDVKVYACISDVKKILPKTMLALNNIEMVPTFIIMARQIVHSVENPGLSEVYRKLMNFEDCELYYEKNDRFTGRTIKEISGKMSNAVVCGIVCDVDIILNPDPLTVVGQKDQLILLEEEAGSYRMNEKYTYSGDFRQKKKIMQQSDGKTVIFGRNLLIDTVVKELSVNTKDITIVSTADNKYVNKCCSKYDFVKRVSVYEYINDRNALNKLVKNVSHIILLANREIDWEEADINTTLMLLKLIDLRKSYRYSYNIVVELVKESSVNYIKKEPKDDYVITSTISSLLLAQLSENSTARETFNSLLARKGQTLLTEKLDVYDFDENHIYSFGELKYIVMSNGSILLGYCHNGEIILNPHSTNEIKFDKNDFLIVIGNVDN